MTNKEKALKLINEYLAKQEPQKVQLADDIQRLLSYYKGIDSFGKNIDIIYFLKHHKWYTNN